MATFEEKKSEIAITAPSFLWLILFFLIPTLIVYAFAFKPAEIYGGLGEGWTLSTIKELFNPTNVKIILRSFAISIAATIVSLVIAIPVGYGIARVKSGKIRQILLLLIILPFWSSFIIRIYAWKFLLHPEGFIKKLLVTLHLADYSTILLYNNWTVILVMVYTYLPFAILPIYAAASKFDEHLYEAAADLGMTRTTAFFRIFLPTIKVGLVTAFLLVFIPSLGAYVIPDVVGGPQSEMIGNKIVQKTFSERNIPLASALSAFLSLVVLIPLVITGFLQKRVVKGGH